MKNKKYLKIIFDIIMLILLVLMFKKNAVNMSFHEVGGLILIGLFIVHNLINYKWLKAVFSRFFSTNLNKRTRFGAIVNLVLAVVFILIGISGILITHGSGGLWKTIHYFCAGLSIIFMGIHLGLHWGFVKNAFVKLQNKKAAKVIGLSFLVVTLAYGAYGMVATSFSRWLTMPFSVSDYANGNKQNFRQGETGESNVDEITASTQSVNNNGHNERMAGGNHQNGGDISAANIFSTITSFLSIIVLFAFITVLILKAFKVNKVKMKKNSTDSSEKYISGKCREI